MKTEFINTEIAQRAKAIYERYIQHKIKPEDTGKYLVIDLDTGEYEMDNDDIAATMRAYQKKPTAERYSVIIGHRTTGAFHRPSINISTWQ